MSARLDVAAIATPSDVEDAARRIVGSVPPRHLGTIHVTAVADLGGGALVTLAIGARSPKSDHDAFVLGLARAHADAIVTTGKNLRDEPNVRYALFGPGKLPEALARYRRERLGRAEPPRLVILTGGDVDLAHPGIHAWAHPEVLTDHTGAERLASTSAKHRVPVVVHERPSLRDAIAWLRADQACATVSIEAGARSSKTLYEGDATEVDALWLARFEEPTSETPLAEPFLDERALEARMARTAPPFEVLEPSGRWRFEAWARRA